MSKSVSVLIVMLERKVKNLPKKNWSVERSRDFRDFGDNDGAPRHARGATVTRIGPSQIFSDRLRLLLTSGICTPAARPRRPAAACPPPTPSAAWHARAQPALMLLSRGY